MTASILNIIAIIILIVSALFIYTIVGIKQGERSKDPKVREDTKVMKAKFWKDIDDVFKRRKSLDDVLNDKYWKNKD